MNRWIVDNPITLMPEIPSFIHYFCFFLIGFFVNNSKKYVLVVEYFNPTPTTHVYRGYSNRLFKRDFAGELMDGFNLKLIDYSFIYSRDNVAPSDNFTWFLMEK